MVGGLNVVPQSSNNINSDSGYDVVNKQVAAVRLVNMQQDSSNNYWYGDQAIRLDDNADVAQGSTSDTTYSGSGAGTVISLLKGLFSKLAGILSIQQSDVSASGTLNAGSGVGSTLALTIGNGQTAVEFYLAGTFSAGTNIIFEESGDNSTWTPLNGRTGNLATPTVNNVNGGAALVFRANIAAAGYIRARVTAFQSGDSISVLIRAGAGIGQVGVLSAGQVFNPITGLNEIQRSAAGTLDTSNGQGIADVIGYLWNGKAYDRPRTLQSKGYFFSNVSSITVGQNSATFASNTSFIQPGTQIQFLGTQETLTVSSTYVPGTASVTFTTNFANTHTSAQWNGYFDSGAANSAFLPDGVLLTATSIFDPASFLYYTPSSFSQDGLQGRVVPASGLALYNGSTVDRAFGKNGVLEINPGGRQTSAIAAAAAAAALKTSAGKLGRVLVTTAGSSALTIYDNTSASSGTIIGYIPANAAASSTYDFQMPAANGIWVASGTNTPAVTISWT